MSARGSASVCAICEGPSDCWAIFDDGSGLCRECAESEPPERFPRFQPAPGVIDDRPEYMEWMRLL